MWKEVQQVLFLISMAILAAIIGTKIKSETFSKGFHYVHIPKTGGTSIIKRIGGYDKQYPWWNGKNRCVHVGRDGVRKYPPKNQLIPKDHISPDDMISCGHVDKRYFDNKRVLCTVRDPYDRFVSEANYRHKSVDRMIHACENASPTKDFDVWAHCRPQNAWTSKCTDFVSIDSLNSRVPDVLKKQGYVPQKPLNVSKKLQRTNQLTAKQKKWIANKYRDDIALFNKIARPPVGGNKH